MLFAELNLSEVVRGKYDFDVVGHYARPDVFQLLVDEYPKSPVVSSHIPCPVDLIKEDPAE